MSKKKKKKKAQEASGTPCPVCGEARELFWHGRRYLCEPCYERTRHPVETGPITTGSLFAGAWLLAREAGPKVLLVTLFFSAPAVAFSAFGESLVPEEQGIVWVIGLGFVQAFALPVATDLGLSALDRETPRLRASLGVGLRRFIHLWFGLQIEGLIVAVYGIFLLAPGFVKASSYALLTPLIVSEEAGPISALEESSRRMHGHRRAAFPALLLVWLPFLASQVYQLAFGPLTRSESTPAWASEVDPYLTLAWPLCDLVWLFVVLALHAKTRSEHRVPFDPARDA
jgi:hypothetical protein